MSSDDINRKGDLESQDGTLQEGSVAAGTARGDQEKSTSSRVNWDGDNDELNPQNWTAAKKWQNMVVIGMMTYITYVEYLSILTS